MLGVAVALYLGVGAAVVVVLLMGYLLIKLKKIDDRMPREQCRHLEFVHSESLFKYECSYHHFDRKPKYCVKYEPRQEQKDG